jgi:hypothetical protein
MQESTSELRHASILRSIGHIKDLVEDNHAIHPSNATTDHSPINKDGKIIPSTMTSIRELVESVTKTPHDATPDQDSIQPVLKPQSIPNDVTMIHGLIMNHGEMDTHEVRASQCITTPLLQVFQLTQTEQLTVGGTTSISHVLDVTGDSTFSGTIHAKGIHDKGKTYLEDLVVDNTVDIHGKLVANSFQSAHFEIDEKGNMDTRGDLWVGGHTSIYGGLGVSSGLVVNDDAIIMGSTKTPLLEVYELLTVGDMPPTPGHLLNVAGNATFNGTIHTHGINDTGTTQLTNVGISNVMQVGKVWITQNGIMVLYSTTGYPAVWENALTQLNEPIPSTVTHLYIVDSDNASAVCKLNGSAIEYVSNTGITHGPCTVYFVVNYISS